MSTAFPAIRPSSRRVTQGQYAVKRFTSIAGTGVTRSYSSRPFNASMDLEFNNIPDQYAAMIVAAYDAARGSAGELELPVEVWDGMKELLWQKLRADYIWRFADQPSISSGPPGVSSIMVRLEGQRDS